MNSTVELLEELKNLNKDLKIEHKNLIQNPPQTITPMVSSVSATITPTIPNLTDDNLNDFILQKSQELISQSIETINALNPVIIGTFDTRTMQGYAEIVNATTNAINTLNAINIEKKKAKTQKDIKQMDIDSKNQLSKNKKPNNTNVLVATREEIIKLLKQPDIMSVIDIQPEEIKLLDT